MSTSLPIRFNVQTLISGLHDAGRVLCILQVHPHPGGLQHQLNLDQTNPTLKPGGLGNGDSPGPCEPVGESDFFGGDLELMGMPAGLGTIFAFGSARVIIERHKRVNLRVNLSDAAISVGRGLGRWISKP
jgi:hypothetical protein